MAVLFSKCGEKEHAYLISDFRRNMADLSPLNTMWAIEFSYMLWYNFPFILSFLRVFIINGSEFCKMLCLHQPVWLYGFSSFDCDCDWLYRLIFLFWFLYFLISIFCICILIDFCVITGINPTWLCCIIFFIYCWIPFANIGWEFCVC